MLAVRGAAGPILPDYFSNFFAVDVALWVGKLRSLAAIDTRGPTL